MAEMAKNYDPKQVEGPIYQRWLEAKAFHADPAQDGPAYSIVIPPPNVTAPLHLGHALNNTLQDILARWKRMEGFNTLWMPGTDHAGIATQTVVEKRILAEEGKRRTDFERADFVARVQAWKDEYEARILAQLRAMGCSCDWDRTRFTMDAMCAKAVRAAFFKLFSDGLIYRGKRLVNWDPATQTVLADDEVEHETVQGSFWYLQYRLIENVTVEGKVIDHVTVATTRPETMLGDTAVAMNPADPRAKSLVGKKVRLPIVGRIIPIIADEHVVLPNPDSEDAKARFSTGFLKVTPAHDPDDYAIGQRHNLPVINVLAPDGSISDKHGWTDWDAIKNPDVENLIGMDRFEAREAIVEYFRTEGLLEDVKPYAHEVGHSYRSHVPIEPYLSDQWFIAVKKPIPGCEPATAKDRLSDDQIEVRDGTIYLKGTDVPVDSLAGLALIPLLDGRLKFVPERYANNYRTWLENLRDWPISRQLWWGHRIPVWKVPAGTPLPSDGIMYDTSEVGFRSSPRDSSRLPVLQRNEEGRDFWYMCLPPDANDLQTYFEKNGYVQDTDVLDTWFSSGLWPISTMGWPDETPELKTYYPTSVLCTAREIITLWVSRMVMFGQYFRGDIPFSDVYIHAMIMDGKGEKMSKSKGNGIDPLDIIESHGADAMRFTLAHMTTETQDVRMPVEPMTLPDGRKSNSSPKFDLGRNFANKLWNASRFAMMKIAGAPPWDSINPTAAASDAWILSRLARTIRDATEALSAYRFHEAADVLYKYMWNDFCDWYLEIAKARLNAGEQSPKAVLAYGLDQLLRLLHPMMPFITEAIWQQLNDEMPYRGPGEGKAEPILAKAAWPRARFEWINDDLERQFGGLIELIGGIRQVRAEHDVPAGKKIKLTLAAAGDDARRLGENVELVKALAGVESVNFDPAASAGGNDATITSGNMRAFVHDVIDREAELARLNKQLEMLTKGIRSIEGKLANEKFVAKAPPAVVEAERRRLAELSGQLEAVQKSLAALR